MNAPLEGVRVIEIAHFVAVPAAGSLLADLGADVIKIELPPKGEIYRRSRPVFSGFKSDFPEGPGFHLDNRGKRSLMLDLTNPEARSALLRVIDTADVVTTNLLPARRVKYGLDHEALLARKPEPDLRRHQRLRPRRRRSRPPRLRLRRLLGAQRHDGPDARRGRAAVDAAPRRRRSRRRLEPGDRDPRRAAHARRDGAGPLRRSVPAPDGALHPRLRHRDGARRARAAQAPRPQGQPPTRCGTATRWRAAAGSCW